MSATDYSSRQRRQLHRYRPRWVLDVSGGFWLVTAWLVIAAGIAQAVLAAIVADVGQVVDGLASTCWGWVILSLRWYQR